MDRRNLIKSGAVAALAAAASPVMAKTHVSKMSQTFVLVHGAWHGGWCWKYVADQLRKAGHVVFTPTLTGQGERHHLTRKDIDLNTHIQDIVAVLEAEELGNVILVGHSYGGIVVSGAAEKMLQKIKRLIYLDALLPVVGKPIFELPPEMEKSFIDGFRMASFPPEMFGVPKDHPLYAWVARRLTDMPAGVFPKPVPITGAWEKLPKSFIECTQNALDGPKAGAIRAKAEKWDYQQMNTGHDAMVTQPKQLADLLHRLSQ
jgi:pimeloyl-ACP methyl ester carboxylesterase